MLKQVIFSAFVFLIPYASHAATCELGYYLTEAGECTRCTSGYYCPDENTKLECPRNTQDWAAIFTAQGYEVTGIGRISHFSWATASVGAYTILHCHIGLSAVTSIGHFYYEPSYVGTEYDTNATKLWNTAAAGYYLSPYSWSSSTDWYRGVKPCTNAPDNAHYTGAGTPDAPDGSIIDANDCPWKCDDGYGLHDGACVPLCAPDMRYIKTSNGLQFNLYPVAYSTPALHVKRGDTVCHAVLAPGAAQNSININHNGQIYHTAD